MFDANDLDLLQFKTDRHRNILEGAMAQVALGEHEVIELHFEVPHSADVRLMRVHFFAMNVDVVSFELYEDVDQSGNFVRFINDVCNISQHPQIIESLYGIRKELPLF